METIDAIDWASLSDAYGSSERIPALLKRAEVDTRPGHVAGSTWFDLWSALCHQGNIYTASYASVPFLIRIAEGENYQTQYDPLLLAATIHVSRSEGQQPQIPADVVVQYSRALPRGAELSVAALKRPLNADARRAFKGCEFAFLGQTIAAQITWDEEA